MHEESVFGESAAASRVALRERWQEVQACAKEFSIKNMLKIDSVVVLDTLRDTDFNELAAHVIQRSQLPNDPSKQQRTPTEDSDLTSTLAAAFRLGLALVLLFRIDIMPIRGSKALANALARAMHILRSSESSRSAKEHSPTPGADKDDKKKKRMPKTMDEKVVEQRARVAAENRKLRRLLAQQKQKDAEIMRKMRKKAVKKPSVFASENQLSPGLMEDDDFEDKRAEDILKSLEGKEIRDEANRNKREIFSKDGLIARKTSELVIPADPEEKIKGRTETELRTRAHFSMQFINLDLHVQVVTDKNGVRHYGDTSHIGPKGYQYTWQSFANILCLHAGHAIPMNRLETILGGKPFTRNMMSNCITDFAEAYLPVYKHIATGIIANASLINADDGHTRTNETTAVAEAIDKKKLALLQPKGPKDKQKDEEKWYRLPWGNTGTIANALDDHFSAYPPFDQKMLRQNSFDSYDLNVEHGHFTLQTTVLTCVDRTPLSDASRFNNQDAKTPVCYRDQSRVVFFRSDFKSAGYLLGEILAYRSDSAPKTLTIQCDFSKENIVHFPKPAPNEEPSLLEKELAISYAGCGAHARRPFFRYHDADPELCDLMLGLFRDIATTEGYITEHLLSPKEIVALRQRAERPIWQGIMFASWSYIDKWSAATPLGRGLRYIITGGDQLIRYLDNAELEFTNNISENALRFEALNDSSSFGCATYEGRVRLDILRTAYASAVATQIDPKIYLVYIMLADEHDLKNHPERYTPAAFKTWCHSATVCQTHCPCCKSNFTKETKITVNRGVSTCSSVCSLSKAKRALAIMSQEF
jgi:hypothetical protein